MKMAFLLSHLTYIYLCTSVTVLMIAHLCICDQRRLSSRVVTTKYGALRGYINSLANRQLQHVEVFQGIPYASAPIGSLRFMPPVTPPHWRGIMNADHLGPVCPQKLPDVSNETLALRKMPLGRLQYIRRLLPYLRNQSEDCLYLNIYAPAIGKKFLLVQSILYVDFNSFIFFINIYLCCKQ